MGLWVYGFMGLWVEEFMGLWVERVALSVKILLRQLTDHSITKSV